MWSSMNVMHSCMPIKGASAYKDLRYFDVQITRGNIAHGKNNMIYHMGRNDIVKNKKCTLVYKFTTKQK